MKKLFRRTDKTVQTGEYENDLYGCGGVEEAIEGNAEYGEAAEDRDAASDEIGAYYAGQYEERYAGEGGGYYAEENPEEEDADAVYMEGEDVEVCADFSETEAYYTAEGEEYRIFEDEGYHDAEDEESYAVGDEELYAAEDEESYAVEDEEFYAVEDEESYGAEDEEFYAVEDEESYTVEGSGSCVGEGSLGERDLELSYLEPQYIEGEEPGAYCPEENAEYCTDDAGMYYTGENAGYYTENAGTYYTGEDGAYHAVGAFPGEVYTEAEYAETEYIEGDVAGETAGDAGPAYGGNPYGELFREGEDLEDIRDKRQIVRRKKQRHGLGKLDLIDKVMLGTGVAVLILAVAAGSVLVERRMKAEQVSEFAGVGMQLEGITVIGEKGLAAVADAEAARMEAAVLTEEDDDEKSGYDENTYDRQVSISPVFTSIHKDLKIKFINQKTGKLVPNVPFSVTVTDPAGESIVWSDEDMDGIIYKKDIAAGNYRVAMDALEDSRFSEYALSAAAQTASVQEEIVYKPVDVANEVKTESEVDVAKEDTKQNETVVESVLTDTVAWVNSKVIGVTYNEIAKSEIPNPETIAVSRILTATVEESGSASDSPETEPTVEPIPDPTADPETEPTTEPATDPITEPEEEPIPEPEPDPEPDEDIDRTLALDRSSATVFVSAPLVINATVDGEQSAGGDIAAWSSNEEVAQVSVSGWAVTVTGVGKGGAEIKVRYTEDGAEAWAVCTVTVKTHPKEDTGTKLKDAAGNQLYVLEKDVYREAVYADYYRAEKFFIKGGARYFGWQTIEGKIYYYTADGVRVTGEQVIQGARYQFAADGALVTGEGAIGIDVSKWNNAVDWNAVKNSGISYVIIRSGYRGSSAGKLIEDSYFESNMKGALAAGLKVGVYFYSQAIDEIEAVEEASMVLEQIQNYKITYPVFIDVERSGGRGDKIDSNTRTAVCRAFCQTIENAGYTAGIYSNKLWMEQQVNMSELNAYKVWLAQYAASPTYSGKYDIWQYKANGSVSGVNGNVDMNISYLEN